MHILMLSVCLCLAAAARAQDGEWRAIQKEVEALYQRGDYPAGKAMVEEALAIREATADLERTGTLLSLLATADFVLGDFEAADRRYRAAISALGRAGPVGVLALARALADYAGLLDLEGQHHQAERRRLEALRLVEPIVGADAPGFLAIKGEIAVGLFARKDYTRAETLSLEVIAACERAPKPERATHARMLDVLGYLRLATRRPETAIPAFEQSHSINEAALGPRHPVLVDGLIGRAVAHASLRQFEQAKELLRHAGEVAHESLGPAHPLSLSVMDEMSKVLRLMGRRREARQLEASIQTLRKQQDSRRHTVSWTELLKSNR